MTDSLAYLHEQPQVTAQLRTEMSDFQVFELLPFSLTGEGEHLFLNIRKTGANTVFVARQLAKYFGVRENMVSYAGLKDRFAVTEQWFSVHLPGKQEFVLDDLNIEGVELLSAARHNKKLKLGALSGNRFVLTLRNVSDIADIEQRWQKIVSLGVPNYYGEQRFGIEQGNLAQALAMFTGTKVKDRKKRSIYLSAARSFLFNQAVSTRIQQGLFSTIMVGDVCMLAGSQSVFPVPEVTDELVNRLTSQDIDLTCPLWGQGELMTTDSIAEQEQKLMTNYGDYCQGLTNFGLKQERRRARLTVAAPSFSVSASQSVVVSFVLPSGCYATTVMRELVAYQDMTQRVQS